MNLLYGKETIQYSVMAEMDIESKKEWINVYV